MLVNSRKAFVLSQIRNEYPYILKIKPYKKLRKLETEEILDLYQKLSIIEELSSESHIPREELILFKYSELELLEKKLDENMNKKIDQLIEKYEVE